MELHHRAQHPSDIIHAQPLTDDIREFTRLSDVNLDDLKLLLAEYRKLLNTVREQIDPSGRDEAFAVYSQVYRLYEDSARIWEVHSKSSKYLASAKEQWRKEVQLRAVSLGKNVDNTDIIKAIAAFEFVIQEGHIPNTLYPSSSRIVTGIADIQQRYPELADEFKGYSFVKKGAVAYLWQRSELTLVRVQPNLQIESTPPYGQSLATRSSRLATRTSGKRLENAEKAAAEKSGGKVATAKAQHRPGSEATNKEDDVKRRETAAAGKLRLAKQFLEKKQFGDARKWLKGVISDYPGTAAAKEAADLMESIK